MRPLQHVCMADQSTQQPNIKEHIVLRTVVANVHRSGRHDDQAFARGAQLGSIRDIHPSFSGPKFPF